MADTYNDKARNDIIINYRFSVQKQNPFQNDIQDIIIKYLHLISSFLLSPSHKEVKL